MAYLPPHKRHSGSSEAPSPSPPTASLRSLSISSSPRGRHRPRPANNKIIHAAGCVSRWSPLPPFSPCSDDAESLRLEPFPCDSIERKTGAKPLVLVLSSSLEGYSGSAEAAAAAIAERFLPDLLASAKRAMTHDVDREKEDVKLSLVARVGKVFFQPGGSPVSLDALREAAKAGEEGSRSQVRKSFYTNMPCERLDDMERSAVEMMGLEFDSSKEHYHVKVFDKHRSDSTISCKCTLQEDGKLAIHKVELNQIRQLVEDITCMSKDLDLRLMLSTKRILKNLDTEVQSAIETLVSSAIVDPDVKGGLRWSLGKESTGERFSIVGVWHTNYRAFRNKTIRFKLRHADRFDHRSLTGEVSNEVTFKLIGISRRLQDGDQEADAVKQMLESAVRMIWDSALNYKLAP
ncbi:uncharacterized protein LOC100821526 [Brachypodium distachyon]|uniref:DUF7903 domain-containing protein n=1 Tax=Brachypodium distachyon TaxID=15368 RepID=I1I9V2_BRADI|nr:uncharacterized protein LOC100821526 [Brachypodium distachyon]KQJ99555.1 hypothetical protein BRADI_3g43860v3 [Brachypodium distachyon]|eukprot:XP_003574996.1 uncharacterized protein LOC100821526 [Brachypodium distachyon]